MVCITVRRRIWYLWWHIWCKMEMRVPRTIHRFCSGRGYQPGNKMFRIKIRKSLYSPWTGCMIYNGWTLVHRALPKSWLLCFALVLNASDQSRTNRYLRGSQLKYSHRDIFVYLNFDTNPFRCELTKHWYQKRISMTIQCKIVYGLWWQTICMICHL